MDLHSDHPWWLVKNGLLGTYPPLNGDAQCQVLIMGGGISGALVAARLVEKEMDVLMVDGREFGMGSTCASTNLLLYELDAHLVDLQKLIGTRRAQMAYRASYSVIGLVPEWVEKAGGPAQCALQDKKSFYMASSEGDAARLRREFAARREMGIRCRLMEKDEIADKFSFEAPLGLLSEDAAAIDVYRFTHGLIRYAAGLGLRAYDRTGLDSITERGGGIEARTSRGGNIQAEHIVIAAGYESQKYLRKQIARNVSTYAFASEPVESLEGWWDEVHIWESARPYIYMAVTPERRILMGGGDEPYTTAEYRDTKLPNKVADLKKRFGEMFPRICMEPAFCWAGTFAETSDGLPRIGRTDEWEHALFALGYGGNGITFSMIAAEIITGELTGNRCEWADAFAIQSAGKAQMNSK